MIPSTKGAGLNSIVPPGLHALIAFRDSAKTPRALIVIALVIVIVIDLLSFSFSFSTSPAFISFPPPTSRVKYPPHEMTEQIASNRQ